jgi:hypothetical protein
MVAKETQIMRTQHRVEVETLLMTNIMRCEDEKLLRIALDLGWSENQEVIGLALELHRENLVDIATTGDNEIGRSDVLWHDDEHDIWAVEESHPYGDSGEWQFALDTVDSIEIPGPGERLFIWLKPPEEVE